MPLISIHIFGCFHMIMLQLHINWWNIYKISSCTIVKRWMLIICHNDDDPVNIGSCYPFLILLVTSHHISNPRQCSARNLLMLWITDVHFWNMPNVVGCEPKFWSDISSGWWWPFAIIIDAHPCIVYQHCIIKIKWAI